MGTPVYKIRGHHLLGLAHFLFDDEYAKKFDFDMNKGYYGADFLLFEDKVWSDFARGQIGIKLIIGKYDVFCLKTGCYKKKLELCAGMDGREDKDIIVAAGLEPLKAYSFQEIKGNLHAPAWYYIQDALMHDGLTPEEREEYEEDKVEIEKEEKSGRYPTASLYLFSGTY